MWDYVPYYVRVWDWRLFLSVLLFLGLQNVYQLNRIGLRLVLAMAFANVALRFLLDTLIFGRHAFSLQAGVTGVG